jgi:predicted DNA-binding antitoxin AbrB/MazE fold protein
MRGGGSKKGFIYKNNIFNHENIEKEMLPKMQRTIEVVYEKGVFKPLEKVELREGKKVKMEIKEEGIIELAKKFSGIGKYKGKLDADKLYQLEVEEFG